MLLGAPLACLYVKHQHLLIPQVFWTGYPCCTGMHDLWWVAANTRMHWVQVQWAL